MATQNFDNLNDLSRRFIPYERYFGEMDISDEQRDKRIDAANRFEEMMLFFFALIDINGGLTLDNYNFIRSELARRYASEIAALVVIDDYLQQHVEKFADEITDTTYQHAAEQEPEDGVNEGAAALAGYWLSGDRARFVAENEANTIYNYDEYREAISAGNRRKQWRAIIDKATRKTHYTADGQIVPIDKPFQVGDSLMMYPKDASLGAGAEEIVNCRCTVRYLK